MDYEYYKCGHCGWIGAAPVPGSCPECHQQMDIVKDPKLRGDIEKDAKATLAFLADMKLPKEEWAWLMGGGWKWDQALTRAHFMLPNGDSLCGMIQDNPVVPMLDGGGGPRHCKVCERVLISRWK